MISPILQRDLVLAIAPNTRGFGYAVLEGDATLVDWGVKTVSGDKNIGSLKKIEELLSQYTPAVLVMENFHDPASNRSSRIRAFGDAVLAMAKASGIRVKSFSVKEVREIFFGGEPGTKYRLAEILVQQFPDELGYLLPRKRLPWTSEDYRMATFEAVALTVTFKKESA